MGMSEILSIVVALVMVGGVATFGLSWVRRAKGGAPENQTPSDGKK